MAWSGRLALSAPTLADVAERAGVSRQTVSNAVNNPELLRPDTLARVQDAIATNGLRSLNAGVPGFTWEGLDIDTAPSHFVQLALEEYFELRALFLWLMSPENLSPFQSDLRQV